ncbi:MAG: ATP-binding protein [Patescibacteria group bacterium]
MPPFIVVGLLLFFVGLYILSRKKFVKISAVIYVSVYYFVSIYLSSRYGIGLGTGLLFYILTIVISGILVSAKFSFVAAVISSVGIMFINIFHNEGVLARLSYWEGMKLDGIDVILFSIVFFIVATVSWLSNREIEKSLTRARKSEAELKEEKDMLEIRVEERTQDLQKAQMERLVQLSRFAEMGRLSVGLFHDLVSPLTAVSLGVERIKNTQTSSEGCHLIEADLERVLKTTERIGKFITSVRKQISGNQTREIFSVNQEIKDAIQLMAYPARQADVSIIFSENKNIETAGSPIRFSQMIVNLISNAVDSFPPMNPAELGRVSREIVIRLAEDAGQIMLSIGDNGRGISADIQDKIFEPFFTTKDSKHGTGVGLSMVKSVAEIDFHGKVMFESEENKGTKFIITFPKDLKI